MTLATTWRKHYSTNGRSRRPAAHSPAAYNPYLPSHFQSFNAPPAPAKVYRAKRIHQNAVGMKASFDAAKASRFKRIRSGLGGTGDAHYTSHDLWVMREYARDYVRNDMNVKALFARIADYVISTGFEYMPNTGDKALDTELKRRMDDWAGDKDLCDVCGKFSLHRQAWMSFFGMLQDGDGFLQLHSTGDLAGMFQGLEGDRCVSPGSDIILDSENGTQIVHGIRQDELGRAIGYFFSKIGHRHLHLVRPSEMNEYSTYDANGEMAVLHMLDPFRQTQSRGLTVLHPVFKELEKFNDASFAELIRLNISACCAIFVENMNSQGGDLKFGVQTTENVDDQANTDTIEEMAPGLIVRGKAGQKLNGFSPQVQAEFRAYIRWIMRQTGNALKIPLEIAFMDFADTNFTSQRAAKDVFWQGVKTWQKLVATTLYSPVTRWRTRLLLDREPALRRYLRAGVDPLRHGWMPPGRTYVEPLKDASADALLISTNLDSPRAVTARRGRSYEVVINEKVEDNELAHRLAIAAAQRIEKDTGVQLDHRELLRLDLPRGMTVAVQSVEGGQAEEPAPGTGEANDSNE